MIINICLAIALICCLIMIFIQRRDINKLSGIIEGITEVLDNHSSILSKHIEFNKYALKIFSRIIRRNTTEEEKKDE